MSQFKEMIVLKIEEQRAAMCGLENKSKGVVLSKTEQLAYKSHSSVVIGLENALQELAWLDKYVN